jgi:hypothetical protein
MPTQMESGADQPADMTSVLCHWCDEPAQWLVDSETTFGGGEDGPEFDAPVEMPACAACRHNSSYLEPEQLTPAMCRRRGWL